MGQSHWTFFFGHIEGSGLSVCGMGIRVRLCFGRPIDVNTLKIEDDAGDWGFFVLGTALSSVCKINEAV